MRIVVVGPGRAGMSIALAAAEAGHRVVAVVGRTAESAAAGAELIGAEALTAADPLPEADLLLIATRDEAIGAVAALLAGGAAAIPNAAHVSGLTPVAALDPLREVGLSTGAFHPLQTLPSPAAGAARLRGAAIAITAEPPLLPLLEQLATDLGAKAFRLDDAAKPLYHAAAAAAANFPLLALTMAADLFAAAAVPWDAARPLVEAVVANAFELGPRSALTGPVTRGDVATVAAQLEAVAAQAPEWRSTFARFVAALAELTGRSEQFAPLLESGEAE
jgi:predicted short-subunit dehydrogenase-like oxidoreductase (DUF2520 family)